MRVKVRPPKPSRPFAGLLARSVTDAGRTATRTPRTRRNVRGARVSVVRTAAAPSALGVALSVVVGFAVSCGLPETLWIPSPDPVVGAQSIVWFIEWDDRMLVAAEGTAAATLAVQFPALEWNDGPPARFRVTAAFYARDLLQLTLPDGRIGPAGLPRACDVHLPVRVQTATVTTGATTVDWQQRRTLSEAQQTFLTTGPQTCLRPSQCQRYRVRVVPLDTGASATQFLDVGDQTVLLAQEGGAVWRVGHPPASVTRIAALDGTPSSAMARGLDGQLYFGGTEGRIWVGSLTETSTIARPVPGADGDIAGLAVSRDDPNVLYALELINGTTSSVAIHRYADDRWRTLFREGVAASDRVQSRLLWVRPGVVLGVYGGAFLLVVDGDDVDKIDVTAQTPITGALNAVARAVDRRGDERFYIGASNSVLYEATTDIRDWQVIGSVDFIEGILGLEAFGDELWLGGGAGAVQAYYPDDGFCAADALAGADAEAFAKIDDTVLVSGGGVVKDNPATVTFLTVSQ